MYTPLAVKRSYELLYASLLCSAASVCCIFPLNKGWPGDRRLCQVARKHRVAGTDDGFVVTGCPCTDISPIAASAFPGGTILQHMQMVPTFRGSQITPTSQSVPYRGTQYSRPRDCAQPGPMGELPQRAHPVYLESEVPHPKSKQDTFWGWGSIVRMQVQWSDIASPPQITGLAHCFESGF